MDATFYDSFWFVFVLLPLLIFISRILDVSIGTLRIIFVSRGDKIIAPILGFFEVLIWILAITGIMANLDNWITYVAYAGGFAAGNYIGLLLEERMALGVRMIRIITSHDANPLIANLRSAGFGVTTVRATGKDGMVHVIYSIIPRSKTTQVVEKIKEFNPRAFYSVEDVRGINTNSYSFGQRTPAILTPRWMRKGK
ncbi:Uncharacterized protein YebE, UPF0316 family [Saccharicrinis carchari]|uniref:UPF0316 protein SAMN06265379_11154 n=1 Tax=Saccharicrinis carchari TaxID=1168039 RepID=A0A521EU72_SACCC|nr:DUF2179 domain-containing protein [Saccharicrinis carchari]SMO87506.1 Uncharacterized protein YebE, UPF0316 family [Saccharicrinis carchari]